MHRFTMPMRWADLDLLNHVTNVVYVDYASQARAAMQDEGVLPTGRWQQRIDVSYLRPMPLSARPVIVESQVDGEQVIQEISQEIDGQTVKYATVTTQFGPAEPLSRRIDAAQHMRCRLRRSDIGPDGSVGPAKLFELFQEGRVAAFARMGRREELGAFVVARVDVRQAAPLTWRAEPVQIHTAISAVGNKSFTMTADLLDDGQVLATADVVCVGFDVATQTSRALSPEAREILQAAN